MDLEIQLTDRKDPVIVVCDRYELKDDWLLLYRDDREIGRYRRNEVKGFHERPDWGAPTF